VQIRWSDASKQESGPPNAYSLLGADVPPMAEETRTKGKDADPEN